MTVVNILYITMCSTVSLDNLLKSMH